MFLIFLIAIGAVDDVTRNDGALEDARASRTKITQCGPIVAATVWEGT